MFEHGVVTCMILSWSLYNVHKQLCVLFDHFRLLLHAGDWDDIHA